jgi:hypothetical protein
MKLDCNLNADGRGKYALIKLRVLAQMQEPVKSQVEQALLSLAQVGVLDPGASPDSEFFVIRLKDKYAAAALAAYSLQAYRDDPEYCREVFALAKRAAEYKEPKIPT